VRSLLWPALGCATLGLAPFTPEPHVWGKLRWVLGGARGMGAVDWFDLAMHASPWIWLAAVLVRRPWGARA
jgi:hypothetical protein